MIQALLKGKLSHQQENMEDLLTSCVFGTLRYLPPEKGLFPFLRLTTTAGAGGFDGARIGPDATVAYHFWPKLHERAPAGSVLAWSNACEPDLLLEIRQPNARPIYILIEAKYRSGKSSLASDDHDHPNDQLAREWDNLVALAQRGKADPYLIYLTADVGIPIDEIEASRIEYQSKRPGSVFSCGWLSWRHLDRCVRNQRTDEVDNPCLRDLARLCERLELQFFNGISALELEPIDWRFQTAPQVFTWPDEPPETINWRFAR